LADQLLRPAAIKLAIRDHTLTQIGAVHGCSVAGVALAWAVRSRNAAAIHNWVDAQPSAGDAAKFTVL
jgi:hypothetical protein